MPTQRSQPWHNFFSTLSMFRNLFKHLEDISANTRQQQSYLSDSGKWSEKISEQLATLNHTLEAQNRTQTPNHELQTLNQELQILNQTLQAQQQRSIRSLKITTYTMAGFGACLVGILSIYSLNLSQFSRKTADETIVNNRASAIAVDHYQSLSSKQGRLEQQVSQLDSVMAQQARMIVELKKLNTTAVRTFVHIRRDLDQRQPSGAPIVKQK